MKWDSGLQILLLLFAAVNIGGLGTEFGALVGSLVIGLVVELAPQLGERGLVDRHQPCPVSGH